MGADVRRIALSGAEAEFQKAGLLDNTPQRSAGLRAVHALLHHTSSREGIDMNAWNKLVPNPQVLSLKPQLSHCGRLDLEERMGINMKDIVFLSAARKIHMICLIIRPSQVSPCRLLNVLMLPLQDKQLLLNENVFAVSHETGGRTKVVFENRPVEVYAAERLAELACKAQR